MTVGKTRVRLKSSTDEPRSAAGRRSARACFCSSGASPAANPTDPALAAASASAWRSLVLSRSSPKVLLLDDPSAALDPSCARLLRSWLRRLHDEVHVTRSSVSHDQEEAMEVSRQIGSMNDAGSIHIGDRARPLRAPANEFVMTSWAPSTLGEELSARTNIELSLSRTDQPTRRDRRHRHLGSGPSLSIHADGRATRRGRSSRVRSRPPRGWRMGQSSRAQGRCTVFTAHDRRSGVLRARRSATPSRGAPLRGAVSVGVSTRAVGQGFASPNRT